MQAKASRLHVVLEAARRQPECSVDGSNATALANLENFVREFEQLDPAAITNQTEWDQFVRRFVGTGTNGNSGSGGGEHGRGKRARRDWTDMLDTKDVLALFGFDSRAVANIRDARCEGITVESAALRWLSRALTAYGPSGCFGDIVNLAHAVLGHGVGLEDHVLKNSETPSEDGTVAVLKRFGRVLREGADLSEAATAQGGRPLWVPTHLVHDAESDDIMALVALEHLHRTARTRLRVLVQLPADDAFDSLSARFKAASDHWSVYRDLQSRNGKAILSHFGADCGGAAS